MIVYNDTINIPLPQYLKIHRDKILHVFDNASGSDYDPDGWRTFFHDNPDIIQELDIIKQKCPKTIGREDVRFFFSQPHSKSYEEIRRLFLACMVWGWGRDYKDQRGRKHTQAALSDPRLGEVLKQSVIRIKSGQIKEAYEGFTLKGCKSAYFTKFFYFVGEEYNIKPSPLILDRHVANALDFLGKQEGWSISTFLDISKRKENGKISSIVEYPKGYIQYICSMHDWATELGCSPDNIEYFMYKQDKESTTSAGKYQREGSMSKYIYKASDLKGKWMVSTKQFCEQKTLCNEYSIIVSMERPPTWNLKKEGNNGKPYWWFKRAVRDNFLKLWEVKSIQARPSIWEDPSGKGQAFKEYLKTDQGKTWLKNNNPHWLRIPSPVATSSPIPPSTPQSGSVVVATIAPVPPCPITISLSPIQKDKLQKFADECDIDISKLVQSWILERLYHL